MLIERNGERNPWRIEKCENPVCQSHWVIMQLRAEGVAMQIAKEESDTGNTEALNTDEQE